MYYLGIDLGGTNIAAGVLDKNYRLLKKASQRTQVPCPPRELCARLMETGAQSLKESGLTWTDIEWIGIGCPGSVNRKTGMVEFSPNLFLEHFALRQIMEEMTGRPVIIENDANAAAYGEFKAGALKNTVNSLAITLGTGIGSGIILNEKIYGGKNGAAGELGHMVIEYGGRPCNCGRRGCWERYASASGLILTTKEMMTDTPKDSFIWKMVNGDLKKVTGRTAFDAMRAGDPVGKKAVEIFIQHLGCGLTNVINAFQPDVICIGGGISHEGEALLDPLRNYVEREQYITHSPFRTKICKALLGNDAGIIGAALLNE